MLQFPSRKPNRIKGYDYSQSGYYFITICIADKRKILWHPSADNVGAAIGRPKLSEIGKVVDEAVAGISNHYECVNVDKHVIMPNHIHLILTIKNDNELLRPPAISTIINQMKGHVTKQLGYSIWQKLFHDHVIRHEAEYQKIWQYIDNNPQKWNEDMYFS